MDTAPQPRPGLACYADFLDELQRLDLITGEQREQLRGGLRAAGIEASAAPRERTTITRPTSTAAASDNRRAEEARRSGLVEQTGPQSYLVRSGPETVHWGYLSSAEAPVLRVAPGATVTIDTVSHEGLLADHGDPVLFFTRHGIAKEDVLADAAAIYAKVQHSGTAPHIVSAPIYIEGAEPGDVLVVHIIEAAPRVPYGVNTARTGRGTLPDEFTLNRSVVIPFDLEAGVAKFAPGIAIPLRPFFGIMATGPARSLGRISSGPPGPFGGNMDLKELTRGTTLYLPVHVPGALFMVGDGHAAQGDGEVNLTAIETSLRGTFRLDLLKGRFLTLPRAETPTHWIVLGLHENLDEALRIAVRQTIAFLGEEKGLAPSDAYALASIAIDFEVTQAVDGVKGIHAMIPKSLFA